MKGFPSTIKTKADLDNCMQMVKDGQLKKDDLSNALTRLANCAYLNCPIVSASSDRKTITIVYCPEVKTGKCGNANISSFEHFAGDAEQGMDNSTPEYTKLVLKSALASGEKVVKINSPCDFAEAYGMTLADIEKAKEELRNV